MLILSGKSVQKASNIHLISGEVPAYGVRINGD